MYRYLLEVLKWIIFFQLKSWQYLSSLVTLRSDRAWANPLEACDVLLHIQIKPWKPNTTASIEHLLMYRALCLVHYIHDPTESKESFMNRVSKDEELK